MIQILGNLANGFKAGQHYRKADADREPYRSRVLEIRGGLLTCNYFACFWGV